MTRPHRIARQRTRGWKMPDNTLYVGRPTIWGNPYKPTRITEWPRWGGPAPWYVLLPDGKHSHPDPDRTVIVGRAAAAHHLQALAHQHAVDLYREALRIFEPDDEFWTPLEGKNLACWCPLDLPCHADLLIEIANQESA